MAELPGRPLPGLSSAHSIRHRSAIWRMNLIIILAVLYLLILIGVANRIDSLTVSPKQQPVVAYPYRVEAAPVPAGTLANASGAVPLNTLLSLMLFGILTVLLLTGVSTLLAAVTPPEALRESGSPVEAVSGEAAVAVLTIALLASGLCAAIITSATLRQRLAVWFGNSGDFESDSAVHKTALVLAIAILSYTAVELILAGGVSGLAEQLEQQTPGALDAVASLIVMLLLAFFGVGLIVRRSLGQVLSRLELRVPQADDLVWGIGTAFICLVLVLTFSALLTLIFSPEQLQQQGVASEQIARAFGGSLTIAFLAASSAAIGEEILFRGALQPVFGLIPTTLFFALLHSQYALTPGSAVIVVVGLAFGILKQRQSTTAAIVAHFTYNFVLLSLAFLAIQAEEAGLLPDAPQSIIQLVRLYLPLG